MLHAHSRVGLLRLCGVTSRWPYVPGLEWDDRLVLLEAFGFELLAFLNEAFSFYAVVAGATARVPMTVGCSDEISES